MQCLRPCPCRDVHARAFFVLVPVVHACRCVVIHRSALLCRLVLVLVRGLPWLCVLLVVLCMYAHGLCSCRSYVCVRVGVLVGVHVRACVFVFPRYAHEVHVRMCNVRARLVNPSR